jgi:hypothetical protein
MQQKFIIQITTEPVTDCELTFIWLKADSFRPVISITFKQVLICLPNFFDAAGRTTRSRYSFICMCDWT